MDDWIVEIQKEMEEYVQAKSCVYNFNFEEGEPRNDTGGRFHWDQGMPFNQHRQANIRVISSLSPFLGTKN